MDETHIALFHNPGPLSPQQHSTGWLAQSFDPAVVPAATLGSAGLLTSGTPRGSRMGLSVPRAVSTFNFVTGTTAAITPTHWWAALTDLAGVVLAVTSDQLTTALPASTLMSVAFPASSIMPAGPFFAHLCVVAATVPTLIAATGLYNSIAFNPAVTTGNSTTTAQTTPPAIGGTIALPASQSSSRPLYWLT